MFAVFGNDVIKRYLCVSNHTIYEIKLRRFIHMGSQCHSKNFETNSFITYGIFFVHEIE